MDILWVLNNLKHMFSVLYPTSWVVCLHPSIGRSYFWVYKVGRYVIWTASSLWFKLPLFNRTSHSANLCLWFVIAGFVLTYPLISSPTPSLSLVIQEQDKNNLSKETKKLTLTNVTFEDAGKYTCVAGNYLGINYRNVWLEVVDGKLLLGHICVV